MQRIHILLFLLIVLMGQASAVSPLSKVDSLFANRNQNFNFDTLQADSTIINQAIRTCHTITDTASNRELVREAVWRGLQAYYYKGHFVAQTNKQKQQVYNTGIKFGEPYVDEFPDSAELHCWMGILWSRWAEVYGIFAAARKGVAGKVKFFAEKTIQLDEDYLGAGGYRMLGMVHLEVPNIPLFLSWPNKDKGLELLKKGHEMAPHDLFNKYYYAVGLLEFDYKAQAREMLNAVINETETRHGPALDAFIQQKATRLLNEIQN